MTNISIGLHPADNGAYRTQDQWINFFNKQGSPMISAADVYRAGKSAPDEVLNSLRKGFDESLLVTSTRISYSGDDLSGRITQNYGSNVVNPSQTNVLVIPVYNGIPLARTLQNEDGVSYLQSLLNTNDDSKTIAGTLENISGRSADKIVLWTPDQDSRKRYSERAVRFYDIGNMFRVGGSLIFVDLIGHSHGMSVSSHSGRAKK